MTKTFEDRQTTERVCVAAHCNVCGSKIEPDPSYCATLKYGGGFDSDQRYIYDMQHFEIQVCEGCLHALFDRCVLPPHGFVKTTPTANACTCKREGMEDWKCVTCGKRMCCECGCTYFCCAFMAHYTCHTMDAEHACVERKVT